ncbi:MAG: glycosyltransferase [Ardenticatenaceae bacterium]|nr:glycosyltransferase [Anaerolineales bacterium]MCB8941730.1 glycosyltransferase [Ardenticatenaceae bacterium]MCB8972841.1 glycosyltransferase [Ardenticatenaceae bacterium]
MNWWFRKRNTSVCVVTNAPTIDWPLFSWLQLVAERPFACTILATKLPQLAWFAQQGVTAVSGDTIAQMATDAQLAGRNWDIYYFASLTAAAEFMRYREVNGRLIVQATNWEIAVLPHLADGPALWASFAPVLAKANRVLVETKTLEEKAIAHGIAPQTIAVVSPGVNLGVYAPPQAPPSLPLAEAVRLLAIFPLEWQSGLDYFLQVISSARDAGLKLTTDLVGYGPERQRLYYLLDEFALFDQVTPMNHLPRVALREKMQQAHFFVQTNLVDEWSQAALEAMACGLPPLAFSGPNGVELLGSASGALLTPPRQPEAMANNLLSLVKNSDAYANLRTQMRQQAVAQHELSRQAAQMQLLLSDVMQESIREVLPEPEPISKTAVPNLADNAVLPDSQMPQLAVATVAVGEPYARWALAMIESVRGNGRFQGPIYVVTDCPAMFAGLPNVPIITVPAGDALHAKQHKTRLVERIPFEQVLFLDADVVVGRPLLAWHTEVADFLPNFKLLMFPDEGFFGETYHTGVILMHQQSEPLLQRWRSAIQSGQYARDQAAFLAVAQPEEIYLMPEPFLLFPTIETFKRGQHTTFNHITFTGRQRNFSAGVIERYLAGSLNLVERPLSNER